MVRSVFRPYTQVRRSICTLEPLRPSTRVSPGFGLLRHSSPSFGSQHVCSHSNPSPERSRSVDSAACASYLNRASPIFTLITHWEIRLRILAHMLDSLVRVTRRDDKRHFVRGQSSARQETCSIKPHTPIPHTESSLTCPQPPPTLQRRIGT